MTNKIIYGDNLKFLPTIKENSVQLIYTDVPFNTKKKQKRKDLSYEDSFEDFIGFLTSRMVECRRILTDNGSLLFHIDYREAHYCKIMLDGIFGREAFINEIVWSYDYGGRSKVRYSAKHDTIFWYAKDPNNYIFNYDQLERIPYITKSGLVSKEKLAIGKTITDVIWCTIVPTNSKEKTGYPTQKPEKLISGFIKVHTNPGDFVLDPFAGAGTLGACAAKLNRNFILIDNNLQAIEVMEKRLSFAHPTLIK